MSGFIITIDGCPYRFTTQGIGTIPSHSEMDSSLTTLEGILEVPRLTITETIRLIDGDLETSGLTFVLHDKPVSIDGATRNVCSWLFTRDNTRTVNLTSTLLSGSMGSFGVTVGTALSSSDFPVWIGQEALKVNRSGNTLTPTTRSLYGTRQSTHEIVIADNSYPLLFSTFPGCERRRVLLWRVDNSSIKIIWRGIVQRGPRVNANNPALFEIACDALWTVLKQEFLSIEKRFVTLTGYHKQYIEVGVDYKNNNTGYHPITGDSRVTSSRTEGYNESESDTLYSLDFRQSLGQARANLKNLLVNIFSISPSDFQLDTSIEQNNARFQLGLNKDETSAYMSFGDDRYTTERFSFEKDGRKVAIAKLEIPKVVHPIRRDFVNFVHIQGIETLPVTTGSWSSTGSLSTALIEPVFQTDLTDDIRLRFFPLKSLQNTLPYKLQGTAKFLPAKLESPVIRTDRLFVYEPKTLTYGRRISATHWYPAIHYGLVENFMDSRNWSWNSENETIGLSTTPFSEADWITSQDTKAADIISNYAKLFLCFVCPSTDGTLTIRPMKVPTVLDNSVATFTNKDYVGVPQWTTDTQSLVNTVTFKSDLFKEGITINDRGSKELYGTGKTLEVDLGGFSNQQAIAQDPFSLKRLAVARLFGLLNKPIRTAKVFVNSSYFETVMIGDIITLSDWILPNGSGTRGTSSVRATVLGKERNYDKGTLTLEVMVWPKVKGSGYAPCWRVKTITGLGTVVEVHNAFLNGGSSVTTYANSAVGLNRLSTGDKVRFIYRNSETFTYSDQTVGTISEDFNLFEVIPGLPTSPFDWATEAANGFIDVTFDTYSDCTATQQTYVFIGDLTGANNFSWLP